jgi:hypothetical protein
MASRHNGVWHDAVVGSWYLQASAGRDGYHYPSYVFLVVEWFECGSMVGFDTSHLLTK